MKFESEDLQLNGDIQIFQGYFTVTSKNNQINSI
jgi:hypothetical protein